MAQTSDSFDVGPRPSCLYRSSRAFAKLLVSSYFKEIDIIHKENIPKTGPLIVVSNHNNQFVDGAMTLKALDKRVISFVVAEVSMHRPIIGSFARWLHSVPVIRAQDQAKEGTGRLVEINSEHRVLIGVGTKFTSEFEKGAKLAIKGVAILSIAEVISDTELSYALIEENDKLNVRNLEMRLVIPDIAKEGLEFKVYPKINQEEIYTEVHNRLMSGGAISIFPEGGSHDQSHLLPFKAGAAVMALGAIEKGIPVRILPVGLNYFSASQFRSKVMVDVGKPFEPDRSVLEMYQEGNRREAYETLTRNIKEKMLEVTINAPDWDTLSKLRVARRLYQNDFKLNSENYLNLYQRFVNHYHLWKIKPEFTELLKDIGLYMDHAKSIGLDDKGVRDLPPSNSCLTWLWTWNQIWLSLFIIIVLFAIALPGIVLNYPLLYIINRNTKKQVAKALRKSTVKQKALDVASSSRVLNFLKWVPIFYLLNGIVLGILIFFLFDVEGNSEVQIWFFQNFFWLLPLFLLVLLPFYTYFTVLVLESVRGRIRLFPIRIHAIWTIYKRFWRGRKMLSPSLDIRLERRNLVIKTQDLILELTKDNAEWQENPIITEEEMMHQRQVTLTFLMDNMKKHIQRQGTSIISSVHSDHELKKAIQDEKNTIGGPSLETLDV